MIAREESVKAAEAEIATQRMIMKQQQEMVDRNMSHVESCRVSVKADQITVSEMKSRIRLAEERASMQIEDCHSMMAREIMKH